MSSELASILTATILITAVLIFLVYVIRQLVFPDTKGYVRTPVIETMAIIPILVLVQIPQYFGHQLITILLTAAAIWLISVKITLATD